MKPAGAYIIAYNEELLIRGAIRCLKRVVDTIVVAVSKRPYFGPTHPQDKTADIASEEGCTVIVGDWRHEHLQRNACLDLLKDKSIIICSDADMLWEEAHLRKMMSFFIQQPQMACRVEQRGYWYDTKHCFVHDPYKPVVAVKPGMRFARVANPDCETVTCPDVIVHHLAWCAPKDIRKKIAAYSHAPQIPADWYDKNFKLTNPVNLPDCVLAIRETSLPEELVHYVAA